MRSIPLLAVVAVALAASAQMNETITVSVVEVPVTVVDAGGNPVRGLTAANFKLFDQGKEAAVSAVDTIDFAARRGASAVAPLPPAARRKFMLVFDVLFSSPASLARAQEAARQFVTKSVQPGDLVGLGVIDRRGFHLVAAFTTDRQLLADAIADPGGLRTHDPLHISRDGFNNPTGITRAVGVFSEPVTWHQFAIISAAQRENKEAMRGEAEKEIDFLGDLAKTLRSVPGRKQLVFLSEGFDPRYVQGSDVREDLQYETGALFFNDERRFGTTSSATALRRMVDAFRGSDVVLHAIDIQGLRVNNNSEGKFLNTNDGLRLLSQPTGGMLFKNANDVGNDFARLMRAEEVVYVLSFRAPAKKAGQFHDLRVKLVGVPGATASARAGYREAGDETPQERALTNAEIVMNDVEQKDLRTASVAAAFPGSVAVVVEVNELDSSPVDFYVYAFDEEGAVRDRLYQRVTLDLTKVGPKLRANGLKYWATLSLPPGRYAVKTLVVAGAKRGFTRTDVAVPAASQLAATAIFVDENPNWVLVKGTSHGGGAYPFDLGGERFVPAATPRTKRFAIFVLNAAPEDVSADIGPALKYLGTAKSAGAAALVMEVVRPVESADVTVHRKGVETPKTILLRFR
jgi:VWFA-related protein